MSHALPSARRTRKETQIALLRHLYYCSLDHAIEVVLNVPLKRIIPRGDSFCFISKCYKVKGSDSVGHIFLAFMLRDKMQNAKFKI